jgi:glucokinase
MVSALGIDIGGTRIKAGVVAENGDVAAQRSLPTPANLDDLRGLLRSLAEELSPGVAGIGVGCKGIIDAEQARVKVLPGTLNYLEGCSFGELLGTSLPLYADNDARAAMVGEMMWGAARGVRNALLFTLGTGVGGAVLAEGRLLRGAGGVAGHVGHLTAEADGAPCICGNRGCLETVFSAKAIEAEAFRAVHAGVESALTREFGSRPGELSCEAVFRAAAGGDGVALRIRDRAAMRLGAAIAGLVLVFDPERVILGGHITEAGSALLDPVTREIHERSRGLLRRDVAVVLQESRDASGVAGAAGMVFLNRGRS